MIVIEKVYLVIPDNNIYKKFCLKDLEKHEKTVHNIKDAERIIFYCDLGMTEDMKKVFLKVHKKSRYDIRWIDDFLWDESMLTGRVNKI